MLFKTIKFTFLFFIITLSSFSQNGGLETFSWQENKPLTWSDFRGNPNMNSDAAAQASSGISFGFSIGKTGNRVSDFKADISCLFYPTESWYKNKDATAYILKHEQLHFNITELHARKFRQYVSKLKPSKYLKKQLNDLYKAINKASSQMQDDYDKQTNHSINKTKQAEWEIFITAEMRKLHAFRTK